ncbi:MAG: minor capsid protein [Lachnospiraceae bacterium]|nr:minor capsid protein [Lachnospiraceae bacterium]
MNDYWERRQARNMFEYMDGAEHTAGDIAKVYQKACRYLSYRARDIFEKYMVKYGLSEAEALRLVNTLQDKTSLDELQQKLKNGNSGETKKELLKQLEAPAFQARLERLQQLQNQIDLVMQDVYQQEKAFSTAFYTDLANEAYYKTMFEIQQRAGYAFSFNHVDPKQIDQVLAMNWSGEHYSSRIWKNTHGLAQTLKTELLLNLITGRTERETAGIIANKFAQGAMQSRRLVRTESNFISGEMNTIAYQEAGIDRYMYVATLDLRTCKECCQPLDGKIFLVSERKIGVNFHPMHPWCRCTDIAYLSDDVLARMKRSAYNPEKHRIELVPATMTYQEWYEKYVEKEEKSDMINTSNTEEEIQVHSVGKINRDIYKCVTTDISTDEVIITDERIQHIKDRHPNDYEKYCNFLKDVVEKPDYIVETNKPNTALILKEMPNGNGEQFKTVLRLNTSSDNPKFKNSIITFMKINEKEWKRLLNNKTILYKKE